MFEFMTRPTDLNLVRFEFPTDAVFPTDVVWLDVECDKVSAPSDWAYRTRTRAFMVGVAYYTPGTMVIGVVTGSEESVMNYVAVICEGAEVRYNATHQYDKLVIEGKWTYVRRGPSVVPGTWPSVQGLNWKNVRYDPKAVQPLFRSPDIASADIPKIWPNCSDEILLHNVRDVLLMVLEDPTAPTFTFDPAIVESDVQPALTALEAFRG